MGLDIVEIVLEVEDAFGIKLPETALPAMEGPRAMKALILAELRQRDAHPCPNAWVFYRLRRAMMDALGIDRKQVRPDAELAGFFPPRYRWRRWQKVARQSGLWLPRLTFPAVIKRAFFAGLLVLGLGCLLDVCLGWFSGGWVLGMLPGFVLWSFVSLKAGRLTARLPRDCTTVRELVCQTARRNYGDPEAPRRSWTEQEVWQKLETIIAEITGLKPDEVTEVSRWKDLGL